MTHELTRPADRALLEHAAALGVTWKKYSFNNQSNNQPVDQSIDQTINQSNNQSNNQSIDPSSNQSDNQTGPFVQFHTVIRSTNQAINQTSIQSQCDDTISINQSDHQTFNQSMTGLLNVRCDVAPDAKLIQQTLEQQILCVSSMTRAVADIQENIRAVEQLEKLIE